MTPLLLIAADRNQIQKRGHAPFLSASSSELKLLAFEE